jgi:phosphoribosyl-dephospho-CoA transferase
MKRIFKKLLSPTPKEHKVDGRFATAFALICQTISMSGLVDNRPLIKTALDIATGLLTKKAFDHGIQTETEPNIEENGN